MKRTAAVFLSLILVLVFSFGSFSAKIVHDGADNGTEWLQAQTLSLIQGESHSGIKTAILKYYVDYDVYDIWMCVQIRDKNMIPQDEDIKIIIYAEGEKIIINPSAGDNYFNEDKYLVDARSVFDITNGLTSEIRLGIKNGIPDEYKFRIQFADAEGNLSNIRDVTIRNPAVSSAKAPETKKEENKTTKKPAVSTEKQERSTQAKTTKQKTTKATTIRLTSAKTTKPPKTTALPKSTKPEKTTAVSKSSLKAAAKSITCAKTSSALTINESKTKAKATLVEKTTAEIPAEKLSATDKYKTVIFASGAVTLILIASLSAINIKKKKEE